MPFIADMVCPHCGTVAHDVWLRGMAQRTAHIRCEECGQTSRHTRAATGGLKNRPRVMDWPSDPEFYRGQISFGAPEAREGTEHGKPVEYGDGSGVIHEAKAAGHSEREALREDKRYHNLRKVRGSLPIRKFAST